MSVTIVATSGAANANSYGTEAEAVAYFNARLPLATPWDDVDDKSAALAMATRVLESFAIARRVLRFQEGKDAYYVVSRGLVGLPATEVQALAWPRIGMLDHLGRVIASDAIPVKLKEAQFELAGQLAQTDRTLDNEVAVQGITSVKAGSVALTFRDYIERAVMPQAVWDLMPPWWFTEEIVEPARTLVFRAL